MVPLDPDIGRVNSGFNERMRTGFQPQSWSTHPQPTNPNHVYVAGAFENTVQALYKYVSPKPKDKCTKGEQLSVSFLAGYIAGADWADVCLFPMQCPSNPTLDLQTATKRLVVTLYTNHRRA